MSKWLSRKFLLTVASALLVLLNEGFGFNLPSDAVMSIVGIVISYILGEGAVDAVAALASAKVEVALAENKRREV